jgi:hypothetical protein
MTNNPSHENASPRARLEYPRRRVNHENAHGTSAIPTINSFETGLCPFVTDGVDATVVGGGVLPCGRPHAAQNWDAPSDPQCTQNDIGLQPPLQQNRSVSIRQNPPETDQDQLSSAERATRGADARGGLETPRAVAARARTSRVSASRLVSSARSYSTPPRALRRILEANDAGSEDCRELVEALLAVARGNVNQLRGKAMKNERERAATRRETRVLLASELRSGGSVGILSGRGETLHRRAPEQELEHGAAKAAVGAILGSVRGFLDKWHDGRARRGTG